MVLIRANLNVKARTLGLSEDNKQYWEIQLKDCLECLKKLHESFQRSNQKLLEKKVLYKEMLEVISKEKVGAAAVLRGALSGAVLVAQRKVQSGDQTKESQKHIFKAVTYFSACQTSYRHYPI